MLALFGESESAPATMPLLLVNPETMQSSKGEEGKPSHLRASAPPPLFLSRLGTHFILRGASSSIVVDIIRPAFPSVKFVFAQENKLILEVERKIMADRSGYKRSAQRMLIAMQDRLTRCMFEWAASVSDSDR